MVVWWDLHNRQQTNLQHLVESVPQRIKAVFKAKRGQTQYKQGVSNKVSDCVLLQSPQMFIQFNVCLFYLDGSLLDRISLFWSTAVCKIFKTQYDVLKCHTKHTWVCVCLLFTKILRHVANMQVINLTFKGVILSPVLIFSLHWAVLFLQSWLYNSLVSHWTRRSVSPF